jgi:hypothetical protein
MVELNCLNCGHNINKYEVLYSKGIPIPYCCEKCYKEYLKNIKGGKK